jgi:large subunit ribosomal protein L21
MYAVCRISGQQFRVEADKILRVPKLQAAAGEKLELTEILMVSDDNGARFGQPTVEGKIRARVLGHGREEKVIVFKKIRRMDYKRKRGHRQQFTELKIEAIEA